MARDVVILGAGASKADGMPVQSELLPLLVKARGKRARRVQSGLEAFFGKFLLAKTAPTFEEVLGILDLALQRQESFVGYPNIGSGSRIGQLRDDLVAAIASAMAQSGRERAVYGRALVARLRRENALLQTGFVSLNYDIIIDNALIDLFPDVDIDYGVPYANYGGRPQEWQAPRSDKSVALLKIHGSLNWNYCSACTGLEISASGKTADLLADEPRTCKRCTAILAPIVIPPSYFKALTNIHLHTIWNRTEQMLREADRLIFCGYSFPDADLQFKYILKRAELGRTTPWDIQVVNGKKRSTVMQEAEDGRYLRFFRNQDSVRFTRLRFEQFAVRGLALAARQKSGSVAGPQRVNDRPLRDSQKQATGIEI
ncbi:MAG: SIR2 family protein [Ferruginibacter sp.]